MENYEISYVGDRDVRNVHHIIITHERKRAAKVIATAIADYDRQIKEK